MLFLGIPTIGENGTWLNSTDDLAAVTELIKTTQTTTTLLQSTTTSRNIIHIYIHFLPQFHSLHSLILTKCLNGILKNNVQ